MGALVSCGRSIPREVTILRYLVASDDFLHSGLVVYIHVFVSNPLAHSDRWRMLDVVSIAGAPCMCFKLVKN